MHISIDLFTRFVSSSCLLNKSYSFFFISTVKLLLDACNVLLRLKHMRIGYADDIMKGSINRKFYNLAEVQKS